MFICNWWCDLGDFWLGVPLWGFVGFWVGFVVGFVGVLSTLLFPMSLYSHLAVKPGEHITWWYKDDHLLRSSAGKRTALARNHLCIESWEATEESHSFRLLLPTTAIARQHWGANPSCLEAEQKGKGEGRDTSLCAWKKKGAWRQWTTLSMAKGLGCRSSECVWQALSPSWKSTGYLTNVASV